MELDPILQAEFDGLPFECVALIPFPHNVELPSTVRHRGQRRQRHVNPFSWNRLSDPEKAHGPGLVGPGPRLWHVGAHWIDEEGRPDVRPVLLPHVIAGLLCKADGTGSRSSGPHF